MTTRISAALLDDIRQPTANTAPSARLLLRMRAEFIEMPGLMLTLPQAARLWCVAAPEAKAALNEMIGDGFLLRDAHGRYRRRGCPRCS